MVGGYDEMSEKTYEKLPVVGQRRARIMYWVDIFTGAALMTVFVVIRQAIVW